MTSWLHVADQSQVWNSWLSKHLIRTPYHKVCLKCCQCSKRLSPATINEHDQKLYCQQCYQHLFIAQVSMLKYVLVIQFKSLKNILILILPKLSFFLFVCLSFFLRSKVNQTKYVLWLQVFYWAQIKQFNYLWNILLWHRNEFLVL